MLSVTATTKKIRLDVSHSQNLQQPATPRFALFTTLLYYDCVSVQMKILEADLNKHYSASKSLQSQIRRAGAEIKTYEMETKRVAEENQVLNAITLFSRHDNFTHFYFITP